MSFVVLCSPVHFLSSLFVSSPYLPQYISTTFMSRLSLYILKIVFTISQHIFQSIKRWFIYTFRSYLNWNQRNESMLRFPHTSAGDYPTATRASDITPSAWKYPKHATSVMVDLCLCHQKHTQTGVFNWGQVSHSCLITVSSCRVLLAERRFASDHVCSVSRLLVSVVLSLSCWSVKLFSALSSFSCMFVFPYIGASIFLYIHYSIIIHILGVLLNMDHLWNCKSS